MSKRGQAWEKKQASKDKHGHAAFRRWAGTRVETPETRRKREERQAERERQRKQRLEDRRKRDLQLAHERRMSEVADYGTW